MSRTRQILADGLCFPEGPRWHAGRFWFSDMYDRRVCRLEPDGTRTTVTEVAGQPSGLGWQPDGRLLVVSMVDERLLRIEPDGSQTEVADLSSVARYKCNDMIVDAAGRAYIGNFGFDLHAGDKPRTTNLVMVTPAGEVREVADGLSFPNGAVILPDDRTLVVAETFGPRLTAFEIQADGSLSNRRVWADLEGVAPDGICLDAEAAIWVASPVSAEVVRVHEGGEISERIAVETQAFACMLGGEDGRSLFVCTASDSDPEVCKRERSGRIEAFGVDVPRAGLP